MDFEPMVGTIWWYSGRPHNMWKLIKIDEYNYTFETHFGEFEKITKKKKFGKGWEIRDNWYDFPPERRPPPPSFCTII
tara:strand:- start:236 stop:469 length:234 start_codon:yes stop_codon:yes gene_type:complete